MELVLAFHGHAVSELVEHRLNLLVHFYFRHGGPLVGDELLHEGGQLVRIHFDVRVPLNRHLALLEVLGQHMELG